jgi:hypothetical protein
VSIRNWDETKKDAVSVAFNRHLGNLQGLFELLEAGLPDEQSRQLARNVRVMSLDSLHQCRMSVDEKYSKQRNSQ